MKVDRRRALVTLASSSLLALALPSLAWADDDDDDRRRNNVQDDPV